METVYQDTTATLLLSETYILDPATLLLAFA
jgi:hypothetical protein